MVGVSGGAQRPDLLARSGALVVGSGALGLVFGTAAAAGAGLLDRVHYVLVPAALVGLLCSPVFVFALALGPWKSGLAVTAGPTAAVAFLGASARGGEDGVMLGAGLAVCTFLMACAARGVYGMVKYPNPKRWECRGCGYDLRGLSGGVCPECGRERDEGGAPPSSRSKLS